MKCPSCGTENPEGKKFCGDCGEALHQSTPAESSPIPQKRSWLASRSMRWIAVIVIIAVLLISVLLVYLSPEYSWDPDMRDHDGDGYADSKDLYPYDPAVWADAYATISVSIENTFGYEMYYDLYLGPNVVNSGLVKGDSLVVVKCTHLWQYGTTTVTSLTIHVEGYDWNNSDGYWQRYVIGSGWESLVVSPLGEYEVSLEIV